MTILSTEPGPAPRQKHRKEDREQVADPVARLTVLAALQEAFAYVVDDVCLAEVDGTVHIYVSVSPATSAGPERIRAAAREAYRRVVCGGPDVVAHVAMPGKGRANS